MLEKRTGVTAFLAASMAMPFAASAGSLGVPLFEATSFHAAETARLDGFGGAVAVRGDRLYIGAGGVDDGEDPRSGRVYEFDANTLTLLRQFDPDDGGDHDERFGKYIAVGDGLLAVTGVRSDTVLLSGRVYIFDTQTGEQIQELLVPDGPHTHDYFGMSALRFDGERIIIGARESDSNGENSGATYIFEARTGQLVRELRPRFSTPDYLQGSALAQNRRGYFVNAPFADLDGDRTGIVLMFDRGTGDYLRRISPPQGISENARFGSSVVANDRFIVIGASHSTITSGNSQAQTGSVYVYDARSYELMHELRFPNRNDGDRIGAELAIEGRYLLVPVYRDDTFGHDVGAAYVFDALTGELRATIRADDLEPSGRFGESGAMEGRYIVIGAPAYDLIDESAGMAFSVQLCPTDINHDFSTDASDLSLILSSFGTSSIAGDLNDDGVVGQADLALLLNEFGVECP